MFQFRIVLVFLLMCTMFTGTAQEKVLYKELDDVKLYISVYKAENAKKSEKRPAIVYYFGGGWNSGAISQFKHHAKYFSKRGMVCLLVDYRVRKRNNTTPFDALKDAKSAMRYIKAHADELGIDDNKIVASGGSAGGYLAAAMASVEKFNTEGDDLSVSTIPNALVLYNPVVDISQGGYGYDRVKEEYRYFSVLHNLKRGLPPTIFFLGTEDHLIPVEMAKYYKSVYDKFGDTCVLKLYEGQKHSFFNYKNFEYYEKTVKETDLFLQSLGYLKAKPVVEIE